MCSCKSSKKLRGSEAECDTEELHGGKNQIQENGGSQQCEKREGTD